MLDCKNRSTVYDIQCTWWRYRKTYKARNLTDAKCAFDRPDPRVKFRMKVAFAGYFNVSVSSTVLCYIDNVVRSAVLMFFVHVCCVIVNKVYARVVW